MSYSNSATGVILKTQDGGNTWIVVDSTIQGYLTSIEAINDSVGYACGGRGRILKITNANYTSAADEININPSFNIFPNPAINYFNLNATNSIKIKQIIIFDLLGKVQISYLNPEGLQFNINSLDKGLYIIEIELKNGNIISKRLNKI